MNRFQIIIEIIKGFNELSEVDKVDFLQNALSYLSDSHLLIILDELKIK